MAVKEDRIAAYDSLIVATGAAQSYFGRDECGVHAPGLTIDDALGARGRTFGAFEMAEVETDPKRRAACLTFALTGAGPSGASGMSVRVLNAYDGPGSGRRPRCVISSARMPALAARFES